MGNEIFFSDTHAVQKFLWYYKLTNLHDIFCMLFFIREVTIKTTIQKVTNPIGMVTFATVKILPSVVTAAYKLKNPIYTVTLLL